MPKVGVEEFPYTERGKAMAEEYAEETGQEVIPTYDAGGRTQRIEGWGDEPSGPSNLIANGAMTDEEAAKYLNPQATSKHGGKLEATTKYKDGKKIKGSEYDPHVTTTVIKKGARAGERVKKYSTYEESAQRGKPSEWKKKKAKKVAPKYEDLTEAQKEHAKKLGLKDVSGAIKSTTIDAYADYVVHLDEVRKSVQRKKATSRVTKPKKHKSKGKWFPSAKDLKK